MFLRVSSLRCASYVESKDCFCNLFRTSSTRCGVVNPQHAPSHIGVFTPLWPLHSRQKADPIRRERIETRRHSWHTSRRAAALSARLRAPRTVPESSDECAAALVRDVTKDS